MQLSIFKYVQVKTNTNTKELAFISTLLRISTSDYSINASRVGWLRHVTVKSLTNLILFSSSYLYTYAYVYVSNHIFS